METRHFITGRLEAPTPPTEAGPLVLAVLFGLAASLACVGAAPFLMPDGYSWIEHSVSESAAQGLEDAWVARLGFLLLAFSVVVLAKAAALRWGRLGRLIHTIYGLCMVGVAAFSHLPWREVPGDRFEDLLHSIAAFGVGMAFIVGVLVVSARRPPQIIWGRVFDWAAVAAAVAISMAMTGLEIDGLVQRVMFLIGYAWYGSEALRSAHLTTS
jgi:hypothetical protein